MFEARLIWPVAMLAASPAATFAPPIDTPVTYIIDESRPSSAGPNHFSVTKQLIFRRTPTGYALEMRSADARASADGDIANLFLRAIGDYQRLTVKYDLDTSGQIMAISNFDPVWQTIVSAVEQIGGPPAPRPATTRPTRSTRSQAMGAALRQLPPERARAMVRSMIDGLIADPMLFAAPSRSRIVSIPAAAPDGRAMTLAGTEHVNRTGDEIIVTVEAAGDVPSTLSADLVAPEPSKRAPSAAITYHSERRYDARTGLLNSAREERDVSISGDNASLQPLLITTITRQT